MSHRLEKINELIKREIGKIIFNEGDFGLNALITVMAAETSPDILHANVVVSVFPADKAAAVLERLKDRVFDLQQILNKTLRMRPVPKIRFVLDRTEEEGEKLEKKIKEAAAEEGDVGVS